MAWLPALSLNNYSLTSNLVKRTLTFSLTLFTLLAFSSNAHATRVKGFIDGVGSSIDNFYVSGWACQTEYNQSINVHVYAGGGAGTGGSWTASGAASNSSETGVASACATTYNKHRFKVQIPREKAYLHRGKSVYVHGISIAGTSNAAIDRSGNFSFPDFPTSKVTGHIDDVYKSGSTWYARGWACQTHHAQSISVHLYANGPVGTGSYIASGTASDSQNSSVSSACSTSGVKHTFKIAIPASKVTAFAGAPVYAHGISTLNTGNTQLYQSGNHSLPAANVKPTVTPTSPSEGATYTAIQSVTARANAADSDGSISRVEFQLDNGSWLSDTTSSYSKAYGRLTVGSHKICYRSVDNSNAYSSTACRNFNVTNVPPTVSPTAPANNAYYLPTEDITATATAADEGGSISRVEFRLGSGSWKSDTSSPYSVNLGKAPAGDISICYRSLDNNGDYSASSCRNINVLGTASLSAPVNNSISDDGKPCFSWQPTPNANYYTLQISSDTNFDANSKRWIKRDLTSTSACWDTNFEPNPTAGSTPSNLDYGESFYWRVKAMTASTYNSPKQTFSSHRKFIVDTVPTVSAGADKWEYEANPGRSLTGTATDVNGSISGVLWSQISGPAVTDWTDKDKLTTFFRTPTVSSDTKLVFRLTATDNTGKTSTDTVDLTVIDRADATITQPTNYHYYKLDDDVIVKATDFVAPSHNVAFVKNYLLERVGDSWETRRSWETMDLNGSKTEATYNWGTPAALGFSPNKIYRVITQVFTDNAKGPNGWWRSRYFYVNDKPQITNHTQKVVLTGESIQISADDLTITDGDHSSHTISVLSGSNYVVSGTTITPDSDFAGQLQVSVKVNDGIEDSDSTLR